jgi:tRNA A37 methylthiotransferase MiaB
MKKCYVFSAGCIRRGLDTIHIQKYLQANGWTFTRNMRQADLIIIATCGVVRLNELNSLRAIAKAANKMRNSTQIVVTGCLPKINPVEIRKLGDFIFVPTGELEKLDSIIQANKPFAQIEAPDSITDNRDITNYLVARSFCRRSRLYKWLFQHFSMNNTFLTASVSGNRMIESLKSIVTRVPRRKVVPYYNVRIADGCMNKCTFCATKFATGLLRSRPLETIVQEFKSGLQKGYKIFQLIAEDTGCYGLDIGTSLSELIQRLCEIEGEYQLVIIDCCPQWLVKQRDEIVPVLVKNQYKIKELFVPVQSGSDSILKKMRRNYIAENVKQVLKELKDRAPGIALRTSFLIGFPGESEEDFLATRQFISDIEFDEVTINRYEDRPGTESSKMSDKVEQRIIESRALFLAKQMNCKILS